MIIYFFKHARQFSTHCHSPLFVLLIKRQSLRLSELKLQAVERLETYYSLTYFLELYHFYFKAFVSSRFTNLAIVL